MGVSGGIIQTMIMRKLKSCRVCVSPPCVMSFGARLCVLAVLLAASWITGSAQQPTESQRTPAAKPDSGASSAVFERDERYRIGPGDVLELRVFRWQPLSQEAVRVDRRGMISLPLLEDEIKAACRTEAELADEIATRYLKYLKNPQVQIFVKEFNSQPVAVIGAVDKPSRFQLQRPVRLLELLAFAGGPTERAGRTIQIVNTESAQICETTTQDSPGTVGTGLISYSLNETLKGDGRSNPYVRPGDTVNVLEAEQVFVVGNVYRPSPIPLKERITVSRAIAMAGGTMPDTKNDKIRIIRQAPGSATNTEIFINLKAIDKRQAEDVALQAGDIVDVPTSGSKRFIRSLVSAVAPAAAQLPVYVIR